LRFLLGLASWSFGWGRAAAASEVIGAVKELHTGLIAIKKAGKTVSFRQRYGMIGPIITRTFDLDTILRQAVGPRWVSLPSGGGGATFGDALRSRRRGWLRASCQPETKDRRILWGDFAVALPARTDYHLTVADRGIVPYPLRRARASRDGRLSTAPTRHPSGW
jgi:hypothetical protein